MGADEPAPFGLGIGMSTGQVAAALLGSDERVEYTLVGDTVNLAQRLEDPARPAGPTVSSAATVSACAGALPGLPMVELPALVVKGRAAPVPAYLLEPATAGEIPIRSVDLPAGSKPTGRRPAPPGW